MSDSTDSPEELTKNKSYISLPQVVHGKEYEDAETKVKLQDVKLKEQETELKRQEVLLKIKEVNYKQKMIEQKEVENMVKLAELKRYEQETDQKMELGKTKIVEAELKNLDKRFEMINKIGLTFHNKSDLETLLKMSKLLGHEISEEYKNDLLAIKRRVDKKVHLHQGMLT